MSKLKDENWNKAQIHQVVLAHLLAEGEKKLRPADFRRLVRRGGFGVEECWQRLRLLYADARRRFLWGEIPPDTQWYVVDCLRDRHLKELNLIAHCNIGGEGSRRLVDVAKRVNFRLRDDPQTWPCPILFANSKNGPYTVLEGNHRLTSYRCENPRGRKLAQLVFVGISPLPCHWHGYDKALMNDLWKKRSKKIW